VSYSSTLLFVSKALEIIIYVQNLRKLLLIQIPVTSRPKQNVLSYVSVYKCGVKHNKPFCSNETLT